jgi:hypothetical protein
MKPLRMVHFVIGVLAVVLIALVAAMMVLSPLQNSECARIERLGEALRDKLETYRQVHGAYPDSLQAVDFPNRPLKRMSYTHRGSGYEISVQGRWYDYTF